MSPELVSSLFSMAASKEWTTKVSNNVLVHTISQNELRIVLQEEEDGIVETVVQQFPFVEDIYRILKR
jgi:hypothetical protein